MAKQTGPRYAVKGAFAAVAVVLAGCSVPGWYSSNRDSSETRTDLQACDSDAQDAILTRTHQDAGTYGPAMPTAQPGNTVATGQNNGMILGETPLQLHDRVATQKSFDQSVSNCMQEKGYTGK